MKNASRAVLKDLDKEAFLKLLIAQLSNQDPMNPMEDREFNYLTAGSPTTTSAQVRASVTPSSALARSS